MSMTLSERIANNILFKPVDRCWRWECMGFWDETIARWHNEGLEKEIDADVKMYFHNNFDPQAPIIFDHADHPGYFPLFEEKVVREEGDTLIKIDKTGSIIKVPKDGHTTLPHVLEAPVKDRETWEQVKVRLNPETKGRIEQHDWVFDLADGGWPLFVYMSGLFGTLRQLFGVEPMMYAYYEQSELVHDISKHWVYMWKSVIGQIAQRHRPDFIYIWEDMAGKAGPMISPKMFDEFMMPYYKELNNFLKYDLNIPVIGVDCDGEITKLIPKFVEGGVNFLFPFEVQAGMDILKVRQDWPTEFAIWGGIDKRILATNKKAIETEVMRVVPPMLKAGGYIPGIDHLVPPDISYENWLFFRDMVRDLVDKFYKIS